MTCYLVAWRNGTLDDYERASRPAEELLDEWVRLRADGYGYRDAAARLGVTPEALDQALSRAKRRGDDRGCRSVADLAHWRRATVTDRRKDPAMNGDVPDRHPEAFCDQCGRRNLHWWTDSELWNVALGSERERVLCPSCFTAAWTAATGRDVVWVLRPDSRTAATADDLEALAPAAVADYVAGVIGRDITSRSELTKDEASRVIDALQAPAEPEMDGGDAA